MIKIIDHLSTGGMDDSIRVWDMQKIMAEIDTEADPSIPSNITMLVMSSVLTDLYMGTPWIQLACCRLTAY